MRRDAFAENEYYHIYNRGVDKRDVFLNDLDYIRFLKSVREFNCIDPIGSLYEKSFRDKSDSLEPKAPIGALGSKLVEIIAYCLNSNHYHFILKQIEKGGISKFMQKVNAGYTAYFNQKYDRTGSLFQGTFKSSHIKSTSQLLRMSVYVNCNCEIHGLAKAESYRWCGFPEYLGKSNTGLCDKDAISIHFNMNNNYENYTKENILDFKRIKEDEKSLLLE